jgi:hypothetical protein
MSVVNCGLAAVVARPVNLIYNIVGIFLDIFYEINVQEPLLHCS